MSDLPVGGIVPNVTTGVINNAYALHRLYNRYRDILFDPKDYGAGCDGIADDFAEVQAAWNAASSAGGGFVPLRKHLISGQLEHKDGVHVFGAWGPKRSQLIVSSDLGAGVSVIAPPAVPGTGASTGSLRDFSVVGPGAFSLGTQTCAMDGIEPGPHVVMDNVNVTGFRAGVLLLHDHNILHRVDARTNYYNVYFGPSPATTQNHTFIGCILTSPALASVACAGNNVIGTANFTGCHFGFGPHGLLKIDGGAASTQPFLSGSSFTDCAWEFIGNYGIVDISTGGGTGADSVVGCTFDRCIYASSNSASHRLSGGGQSGAWLVRNVRNTFVRDGQLPFTVPTGGNTVYYVTGASDETFVVEGQGIPTGAGQFTIGGYYTTYRGGYGERYEATGLVAGGTITKGDLLSWNASGATVARSTTATVNSFAGIAVNDATTGDIVMVALPGSITYLTSEAISFSGTAIRALAGTEHRGTSAGTNPIVAYAYQPGGASGGGLVKVFVRGA